MTLLLSVSSNVFGQDLNNRETDYELETEGPSRDILETYELEFDRIGLSDYANELEDDPDIFDIEINGNTLTYSTTYDTEVTIVESVHLGYYSWTITEGEITDVIVYNIFTDEVTMNNEEVSAIATVYSTTEHSEPAANDPTDEIIPYGGYTWIQMGNNVWIDVTFDRQIRYNTVSAAFYLLSRYLGPYAALTYDIVFGFIDYFKSIASSSKHLYTLRRYYYDSAAQFYHFLYKYDYYRNYGSGYIRTVYNAFFAF